MGNVKETYDILTDLWDRLLGGQKIKRKELADDLGAIASLLDQAREEFTNARIPRREGVWCKYSNELYDIVIKQYYG